MTLAEADAALNAALPPGRSYMIQLSVWRHSHNGRESAVTVWRIWDDTKGFESKSLERAVGECIDANRAAKPLAEAEAAIAGPLAYPAGPDEDCVPIGVYDSATSLEPATVELT